MPTASEVGGRWLAVRWHTILFLDPSLLVSDRHSIFASGEKIFTSSPTRLRGNLISLDFKFNWYKVLYIYLQTLQRRWTAWIMELDISDYGSIEDGTLDEELVSATIEAYNTGKLTPLLKTELKYRIQKKCFEEGKDLTLDEEPQIVQRKAPVSLLFYKYWFSNSVFSFPYFMKKTYSF